MFSRTLVLGALSCATWFGMAMLNCTSGTTPDCDGGEGCGPGFDGPPPEGALSDASSPTEAASDAATDAPTDVLQDVASEAAPDATSDGPAGEAAVGCHNLTGTGVTKQCTYTSIGCPSGDQPGPCPAAGLAGCCITKADSGTTAVCYYMMDVPTPTIDMGLCTTAGGTWVTTAP
jgi:hypothetical protein